MYFFDNIFPRQLQWRYLFQIYFKDKGISVSTWKMIKKINRKREATHCNVFYSKIRSIIKRCLCMGLEQSNSYQRGETLLTLQPHGKLKWLVLIEGFYLSIKQKKNSHWQFIVAIQSFHFTVRYSQNPRILKLPWNHFVGEKRMCCNYH